MITRNSILETLENHQVKIKELGVKRLAIFGSFARNTQGKGSDVDVLVEFRKGSKTFDNYIDLRDFLVKLLRRKVDLVTRQAIKPRMKASVLNEAQYARL